MYLCEDVKVIELDWCFIVAEGVVPRRFGEELLSSLIIQDLVPLNCYQWAEVSYQVVGTYVKPRCDETSLRSARAMSARMVEFGFRHSVSISCRKKAGKHAPRVKELIWNSTSMSRDSEILAALPKIYIHWHRFANCHMLRIRCSNEGSVSASSPSMARSERLRDGMAVMCCCRWVNK